MFLGNSIAGLNFKTMRLFRRDMQIVFRFMGHCPRACRCPTSSRKGCGITKLAAEREARVAALRDVGLDPDCASAIRMNSPAASASVSRRPRGRAGADLRRA